MAIIYCAKCNFLKSTKIKVGSKGICPNCKKFGSDNIATCYDEIFLVQTILQNRNKVAEQVKQMFSKIQNFDSQIRKLQDDNLKLQQAISYADASVANANNFIQNTNQSPQIINHKDVEINLHKEKINEFENANLQIQNFFKKRKTTINYNINSDLIFKNFIDSNNDVILEYFDMFEKVRKKVILSYMSGSENVSLPIAGFNHESVNELKQVLHALNEKQFFKRCGYDKNNKHFIISLSNTIESREFFEKGYLQWLCLSILMKTANNCDLSLSTVQNAKLTLSDFVYRFDILSLINDKYLLVIDIKQTHIANEVEKYQLLMKRLKLSQEQIVVVVQNIEKEILNSLSLVHKITFVNLDDLHSLLDENFTNLTSKKSMFSLFKR